jgi:hypothetical protein
MNHQHTIIKLNKNNLKLIFGLVLISFVLQFSTNSCSTIKSTGIIDTLIVTHQECAECMDAYIIKGTVTLPKYLDTTLLASRRDIILKGKSPFRNIVIGDSQFQGNFKIIGSFYGIDTLNAVGHIIIFNVYSWKGI